MVNMIDDFDDIGPRHVFEALERVNRRAGGAMGRLVPSTLGLRGSHGRILDLIDDEGTRPSALADGAWITKQAVGQRVHELEARGWVTITRDPSDGRAVIVRRTAEGDRIRRTAVGAIATMEEEWAERVGAERYATFRAVLDELGR
jgi:DNA-binding MarR family transcriptional regulator